MEEATALGLAGWIGQSQGMVSAHRHLDLEINYVLTGTMTYLVGGRIVELPLRRLCLLWGGVPHQMIRSPRPAEAIWVTIPLTTVLRWGLPDRLVRPLLVAGYIVDAAPRPGDLDLLRQWLTDLPGRADARPPAADNDETVQTALLEIEARLRRLAQALSVQTSYAAEPPGPSSHSEHGQAAVEAMAHFLCRNFQEPITCVEIAAEAHLHPNYAMTLFRRHTGLTLSQYLTLQRVAYAQRRLATTDDAIHVIAAEAGFGSVSRFYEAFRQQTGSSPGRFRQRLSAG